MRDWYVATVKPGGDMLARKNLRQQGYIVYVPKTYEQLRIGRKSEPVARLRLPGYIFLAFEKGDHGPVNNTRGVGSLLLDSAGNPESLRSRDIARLRDLEDEDFDAARANVEMKERTDLREWDEVIIDGKDHPCLGQKGYFMGSHKGEAKVLIGIGTWPVNMFDLRKVEKAKSDRVKPKKPKRSKRVKAALVEDLAKKAA